MTNKIIEGLEKVLGHLQLCAEMEELGDEFDADDLSFEAMSGIVSQSITELKAREWVEIEGVPSSWQSDILLARKSDCGKYFEEFALGFLAHGDWCYMNTGSSLEFRPTHARLPSLPKPEDK